VVAVLLGLAAFLWEVRRSGGALEGLLLRLGGELGIASERDGPYSLLQGLVRLLNYEVTKEALEREVLGKALHMLLDIVTLNA
jgi:hypothetical protein